MLRLVRIDLRSVLLSGLPTLTVAAVAFSLVPAAWADLQVTLKSGASLVGTVKIEGNEAVVKIKDSELRVPLTEVDTIASVDAGPQQQANRLLLSALEARVMNDSGREAIGLLAEASRLAPTDPHVSFWYASSLADAGYGQAAADVLEKQKESIGKAYPGMVEQLADRIKKRVEMEKMPPALVERLDKLNAELTKQPSNADMRQVAGYFRLVDQEKQPIERSAFNLQCNNGQDQNIEAFDDGYYLFTFNRHRSNEEQPLNLDITGTGFESKNFDINGSTSHVAGGGELIVQRFDESAKRPLRIHVVGPDGKPIFGAQVSAQGMSPRGASTNNSASGETDADGRAEMLVFPMKYNYNVRADGFNFSSGSTDVKLADSDPKPAEMKLDRAIQATIRIEWESTSTQGGGKTSGESTITIDGGPQRPNQYGPDPMPWLRVAQQKDKLTLQFNDQPMNFGGPFVAPEGWVRVVVAGDKVNADKPKEKEVDAESGDADAKEGEAKEKEGDAKEGDAAKTDGHEVGNGKAALDAFNDLDLGKIDDLKNKLKQPKTLGGGQQMGPRPPIVLAAELNKTFVGKVQNRDMRTGQPVQVAFKVFVEEMSTAGE